ncbi:choice-of-anchor I family protein [Pseudoalteromonas denitrificans]|uniref:Choice-of-anchor I domain-containing protein n=1 Tax=Pseudoalteromonas denitrificans DSM 6059 TaxID=1123010 RepID=A0A1I1VCH9_9GAMM|nr:choice-of-anchor I family protein [Pseudoalteromonas denitrificans]SFD78120.1 hypothetical protein SAMN02745724_05428 [Pseudoalteromonas denitrificans DSM 6059]
MNFKRTLVAVSLLTLLSACDLDGDDGKQGPEGIEGTHGSNGVNAPTSLNIELIGRTVLNAQAPEGAAEIVSFQKSKKLIYAINSSVKPAVVEIIDANNIDANVLTKNSEGVVTNANLSSTITLNLVATTGLNGDANSIAIDNNNALLAVAIASGTPGINGHIAFFDISGDTPAFIKNVAVGDLPDNVVFTHDGAKVVVANEGEPSNDYIIDPEGSISVINIVSGIPTDTATHILFTEFNTMQSELEAQGAKFSNPTGHIIKGQVRNYSVAQDLEPEYVAISQDNKTAFISLQENNAMATVDLTNNSVKVSGLGFKHWHNLQLDVSDRDNGVNFKSYDKLYGMYQPDTIASYTWQGANFVISANEGDSREYIAFERNANENAGKIECETDFPQGIYEWEEGEEICIAYTDEVRVKNLKDFGTVSTELEDYIIANGGKNGLGRLLVTNALGKDENHEYSNMYAYGARSFTIWDSNGLVVFDSGDDIGRISASIHGAAFNNDEDENEGDGRSDAKGAEPESVVIGKIGTQTYAFIGLEVKVGVPAPTINLN